MVFPKEKTAWPCIMPERLTTIDNTSVILQPSDLQPAPVQEHVAWNIPQEFSGILKYNPRHDIQDYLDLKNLEGKIRADQYIEFLIQTNARTSRNLEKALGERAVVTRSTFRYSVNPEGLLVSDDYQEPVVQRFRSGQKFLAENGSNETEREAAEIEGMEEVQRILAQGENTTLVIASPRSKDCKHDKDENPTDESEDIMYHDNVFYVFVQNDGVTTGTRYHSNHTNEGFLNALSKIDPDYPTLTEGDEVPTAHLLANPAQTTESVDRILEKFALDKRTKPSDIVQSAVEDCMPMILSYIQVLATNPTDLENVKLHINAIFNNFDRELKQLEQQKTVRALNGFQERKAAILDKPYFPVFASIQQKIQRLGRLPVEPSTRGCPGKQQGFALSSALATFGNSIDAVSVADFAPFNNLFSTSEEDKSDFPCPQCGFMITYGAGIKQCPDCGLEATCA